jgi:hypothetical protein
MDRNTFANHFLESATVARDCAGRYLEEALPAELRFRVRLNSSYDHNLNSDEVVYPDDSTLDRAEAVSDLGADAVIDLLFRDGKVPEWVDINVMDETGSATLIQARVCGRFTANDERLYHQHEGYPPFHCQGPALPPDYAEGTRFSIHHRSECWTYKDLARAEAHATKVWSLDLRGRRFGDRQLEALPAFPSLEILELRGVPIVGPGLIGLGRQPRLRWLRSVFEGSQSLALQELPRLPLLTYLELASLPGRVSGLSFLAERLPALTSLSMGSATMPSFADALPMLPKLNTLTVVLPRLPDGLVSCATTLTDLSIHAPQATSDEILNLTTSSQASLEAVHLHGTPVTDSLLEAAEHWTRLRYINVSGSAVTPSGLERLAAKRPDVRVFPALTPLESPPG